ncbi:MAG: hypothetical protein COB24_14170 [Hyphomicrobiales bacterium]|nr:MAG: hypothetical protein COB24_14170 [Hyphomicrobiales bacterium]
MIVNFIGLAYLRYIAKLWTEIMNDMIQPNKMYGYETFTMKSAISGQKYRIFLSVPEKPAPPSGYPVIYTLDANIRFATVAESVAAFERCNISSTLVIGIGYPDEFDRVKQRQIDMTPAESSNHPADIGGADDFLKYIQQELKPEIARRFKVDENSQSLFGHSFGGLFALYTLLTAPDSFHNYIAASPSLWWQEKMLSHATIRDGLAPKLKKLQHEPRVLITVGSKEEGDDPDFPRIRPPKQAALFAKRTMVDVAENFADFLKALKGVYCEYYMFEGEDHGTVVPVAISRMTRFIFRHPDRDISP